MSDRQPLPGFLTGRSLTVGEGLGLGVTASRMRAKELAIASRQVRVPRGTGQTLLERVCPYTAWGIETYVSHKTAAHLHCMPLPYRWEQLTAVHLTRPAGTSVPQRRA